LTTQEAAPAKERRLLRKGVLGLAALGAVGWFLGRPDDKGLAARRSRETGNAGSAQPGGKE
jgi:hypothetical protein